MYQAFKRYAGTGEKTATIYAQALLDRVDFEWVEKVLEPYRATVIRIGRHGFLSQRVQNPLETKDRSHFFPFSLIYPHYDSGWCSGDRSGGVLSVQQASVRCIGQES